MHQPPAPLGPADPRVLLQGLRQARLHPESIEAVAGLFEKEGSNAWFDRDAADILPKGFTLPPLRQGRRL